MGLKTCCCGCTLKTGSLIIGYLNAVGSGIGILLCLLAMLLVTPIEKKILTEYEERSAQVHVIGEVLFKAFILMDIVCLKTLIINALMIHGINRTKPAYVLPWIIWCVAGLVFEAGLSFSTLGFAAAIPAVTWSLITIGFFASFCLQTYFLVVVSSHYHQMKKSSLLDEEQIVM